MLNGRALRRGTLNRYNHPIAGRHPTRRDQISPYQVWGLGLCRVKSLMIATTQLSHRQSGLCRDGRLTGPFPPGQPVPTLAAYSGFMTQRRGFFRRQRPAHRALGSRRHGGEANRRAKEGRRGPSCHQCYSGANRSLDGIPHSAVEALFSAKCQSLTTGRAATAPAVAQSGSW